MSSTALYPRRSGVGEPRSVTASVVSGAAVLLCSTDGVHVIFRFCLCFEVLARGVSVCDLCPRPPRSVKPRCGVAPA